MNLELRDHERDIVERPLGRRLSRRSHRRARVAVALVAGGVGIASCADILTPNTAPAAYVLTTIVGRPAAEVNLFQALKQADTLYGTYAYIVADTLVLDGHGRGEQRGAYDLYIVTHIETPEVSPIVRSASFRRPIQYVQLANAIRVEYSECLEALCYIGSSPVWFERLRGGSLRFEFTGVGPWQYELVQPPGAP